MRAQPKGSHYINGQFMDDASGTVLESVYPATGEVIALLHEATKAVVDQAVAAAQAAQPAWAALKPVERGRILRKAADILRRDNQRIAEIETLDTGKAMLAPSNLEPWINPRWRVSDR